MNERPVSLLGLSPQFEHQKKLSFVFLSLALCPPLGSVTYSSTPTDQEHGYGEFFLERDASSFQRAFDSIVHKSSNNQLTK